MGIVLALRDQDDVPKKISKEKTNLPPLNDQNSHEGNYYPFENTSLNISYDRYPQMMNYFRCNNLVDRMEGSIMIDALVE